ncbi:hypothetical protein EIP91_004327 [Steccherinum ochraceum]|uniref:DUF6533 domain-containing protein n=1 Tax=Steccherinum ochraceum TaxID=92696 RepID=A0A4R0RKD5_9APHY|nr:hypothetical protein EIP91_004327 [Steccherinum ochraceum]
MSSNGTVAGQVYAYTWVGAACAGLILYDHIITFGQEVDSFWFSTWSLPKVLFLLNRYIVGTIVVFNALAGGIPRLSVERAIQPDVLPGLSAAISFFAGSPSILALRVWALYRGHQFIIAITLTLYICSDIIDISLVFADYFASGPLRVATEFSDLPGCRALSVPFLGVGFWITPLVVESFYFLLVTQQAFGWWRHRIHTPPTLKLLARDSSIYFACICSKNILIVLSTRMLIPSPPVLLFVNLFVYVYAPPLIGPMFVIPSNAAACVACSRMLLNMRQLAHQTVWTNNAPREPGVLSSHIHFDPKWQTRGNPERSNKSATTANTSNSANTGNTVDTMITDHVTVMDENEDMEMLPEMEEPEPSDDAHSFGR